MRRQTNSDTLSCRRHYLSDDDVDFDMHCTAKTHDRPCSVSPKSQAIMKIYVQVLNVFVIRAASSGQQIMRREKTYSTVSFRVGRCWSTGEIGKIITRELYLRSTAQSTRFTVLLVAMSCLFARHGNILIFDLFFFSKVRRLCKFTTVATSAI